MDWEELATSAHSRARGRVSALRVGRGEAEDVAQDALLGLLRAVENGKVPKDPEGYLFRILKRRIVDRVRRQAAQRRREEDVRAGPQRDPFLAMPADMRTCDPEAAATTRELAERALELLRSLPPPYLQIAQAQTLLGWTRGEVTAWLKRWRPVGDATCDRLIDRTHVMLRALGGPDGGEPMRRWPRRHARNSEWKCTPPPP